MFPDVAVYDARVQLTRIGYWASESDDRWPDVRTMVDPTMDEDTRDTVAHYLRHGLVTVTFMGYSSCRICGAQNGDLELSDGVYVWPDGLAHYVADHSVRLPDEVVQQYEEATIDDAWWQSLA